MSSAQQNFLGSGGHDIVSTLLERLPIDFSIYSLRLILERPRTLTYALSRNNVPGFVLKLSAPETQPEQEIALCYKRWLELGIPAPRVTSYGSDRNYRYILMEYIPGVDGDQIKLGSNIRNTVVRNLGQIVARLHRNTPANNLRKGIEKAPLDSWSSYIHESFERVINSIYKDKLVDNAAFTKINNILNSIDTSRSKISELHGDIGLGNVIVNRNTGVINALIDPETRFGDALYELAYFIQSIKREYEKSEELSLSEKKEKSQKEIRIFLAAYTKARNIQLSTEDKILMNKYEALIMTKKISYRSYYDPDNELPTVVQLFKDCLSVC